MLVRALYAYSATSGNDLSIHAAQRLALIEGGYNSETGSCWGDSGWVRVATLDGRREGFVPASYVLLDDGDDGDDDGDDDRPHGLLEAEQEAEQARLEKSQQAAGEVAQAALASKARETATEAAATAAAAVKAAEAAAAQADLLERAVALYGVAAGPPGANEAAEAPDDYDSSSGSFTTGPRYTATPAPAPAFTPRPGAPSRAAARSCGGGPANAQLLLQPQEDRPHYQEADTYAKGPQIIDIPDPNRAARMARLQEASLRTQPTSDTPLGPWGPVAARRGSLWDAPTDTGGRPGLPRESRPTHEENRRYPGPHEEAAPWRRPSTSGDYSTCDPPAEEQLAEDEGEGEDGCRPSKRHKHGRKVGWTSEEDQVIRTSVRKLGTQWPRIASLLPGRTADAVQHPPRTTPSTHRTPPSIPPPPTPSVSQDPPPRAATHALERAGCGRFAIGGTASRRLQIHGQRCGQRTGRLLAMMWAAVICPRAGESYLPAGWRPSTRTGIRTSPTPRRVRLSGRGRLRVSLTSRVTTPWGVNRHPWRGCSV